MQFMVQGAWGVIPAHLNELSPAEVRGTFPGFTYQLGNLIAAGAAQMEATLARGLTYGEAMATVVLLALAATFALSALGFAVHPESRTSELSA